MIHNTSLLVSSPLLAALLCCSLLCSACSDDVNPSDDDTNTTQEIAALKQDVRAQIVSQGVTPLEKPEISPAKAELGKMLFFDSIISGTKDTSCGTCHRPMQATVDGVSLPAGSLARHMPDTGARLPGAEQDYMPRNVPDLFNRGHQDFTTFFWDTNIQKVYMDDQERFVIFDRLDAYAPENFFRVMNDQRFEGTMHAVPENLLAAQNMMPVLNRDELRGPSGSSDVCDEHNELAAVTDGSPEEVWDKLMDRLMEIPEYRELFAKAYPDVPEDQLSFVHAANGISAFIADAYTLTDSPWDRFIAGDDEALSPEALRGAKLFYGKAMCSSCHSGTLMTDQQVYNLGVIPLGSGPSSRQTTNKKIDRGVAHRSLAGPEDEFKFRTPPLRNVELTAPYMHTGTYNTLEAVVRHKNNTPVYLWSYDASQLRPEFLVQLHKQRESFERVESTLEPLFQKPLGLTEDEIQDLVAFLEALTDPQARDLSHTAPERVPSGLPINIPPNPNEPPPGQDYSLGIEEETARYCQSRQAQ